MMRPFAPSHTRLRTIAPAAALIAGAAVLGMAAAVSLEPIDPEAAVENRPIAVTEDGYVSSETCRACHPSQYQTWHGSFHRTMTQVATPESVRADYDGVVVDAGPGRPMRLERRGDEFWAEFDDPRLGGRPARPTAHHPAGGDDHRLAPPEHLLVLDRARAGAQRAARRLPARRRALDAPQRGGPGAARTGRGDARRALERRLHRLPHDARQDPLRYPVPLRADPRSVSRHHRRRARHRLRSVSRTGRRARRRQPEPVAPLRAPRRRRARSDHRRTDAPRPAALVAGLRPVPQHLGVSRPDGRARGQRRRPAVPARRRAAGDPLRRPAAV